MGTGDSPANPTTVAISGSAYPVGQTLETPHGQQDVIVRIVTPLFAIIFRAGKAYLQTLLGLMAGGALGMASNVLPAGDFFHTLKVCAGLSVASGVMSVLTNLLTLFTALGDKYPILKT